jgi:hypothetical protein
VKKFHMKSHVKFHKWKDFTWNHMWHFTCEKISHEITCDISHVKGFHMKLHVTFHMWNDFTLNHMWHFTCEKISYEITSEISHVKGVPMKLQIICTSEISHMWKDFTWNYKWNFTCEMIRISHDITNYKVKFHMYVKGFHMKLRLKFHMWKVSQEITMKFHMWKDFTWNYKQWRRQASEIWGGGLSGKLIFFFGGGGKIELLNR